MLLQKFKGGLANGKYSYAKRAIEKYGQKCELCDWDKTVEVHHIDGDRNNNRLSNLVVLYPNCHSLTETNKFIVNEHLQNDIESRIRRLPGR